MAGEVLLAHPLKVRAIADARIKTDKIDSEMCSLFWTGFNMEWFVIHISIQLKERG